MNIKNRLKSIMALSLLAVAGWACEENDDFLPFEKAPSVITFDGYPGFEAEFSVLDQVVIPVTAPGAAEIQVIREISYTANDNTNNIDQTLVTLSGPEAVLDVPISQVIDNPDNVSATNISSTDLLFQVTENEQTTFRRFSLAFYNPFVVTAPEEAFNDSTLTVSYELQVENANVSDVQVFLRESADGDFSGTPLQTFSNTEGELEIMVPAEAIVATGGDIGLRFVATSAGGLTATETVSIDVVPITLETSGEATLEVGGNAIDFSAQDTVASGGDLRLIADGDELQIEALGGSDFVLAPAGLSFDDATYQDLRDAYMASTAQTELEDIANLPTDQLLIVSLADVAEGSADRYAVVRVGQLVRGFEIGDSELALFYRSR
jgi:hypothetical protein